MQGNTRFLILALATCPLLTGCPADDSGAADEASPADILMAQALPQFPADPADFVAEIDNPYLGYALGKVFTYENESDEGLETIVVEVTHERKTILGVSTTVVRDQVFLNGELIEDTL